MKARLAKKILKNLSVLHLDPGDVLVVSVPGLDAAERAKQIGETMTRAFPGRQVLVVPSGYELSAVRYPGSKTLKLIGKDGEVLEEIPDGLHPGEWVTPPHLADTVRAAVDEPPAGGEG